MLNTYSQNKTDYSKINNLLEYIKYSWNGIKYSVS